MRMRLLVAAAAATAALSVGVAGAQAGTLAIHVLSDRADAISSGDALVSVAVPRGVAPSSVKMTLGSSDVTSEFALHANGSYEGLLTGLAVGSNVLSAEAPGQASGQATIIDHPNGGPAFSGSWLALWLPPP